MTFLHYSRLLLSHLCIRIRIILLIVPAAAESGEATDSTGEAEEDTQPVRERMS